MRDILNKETPDEYRGFITINFEDYDLYGKTQHYTVKVTEGPVYGELIADVYIDDCNSSRDRESRGKKILKTSRRKCFMYRVRKTPPERIDVFKYYLSRSIFK